MRREALRVNKQPISSMLEPKVISAGTLLVGAYSALNVLIYFDLKRNGYRYGGAGIFLGIMDQKEYLRVRAKHGWPAWPILVLWPCLVIGVTLIAGGLFRR
jgi:hypothetical protein